jgi:hypothetical protein
MEARSRKRSRSGQEKDQKEIEEKKKESREFSDWRDKGILADFQQLYQIDNPRLHTLLPIAMTMASIIGVSLGRQEKRRRGILIGWFNKNYELIRPLIPMIVFQDDKGNTFGPCSDDWARFQVLHSDSKVAQYVIDPQ